MNTDSGLLNFIRILSRPECKYRHTQLQELLPTSTTPILTKYIFVFEMQQ